MFRSHRVRAILILLTAITTLRASAATTAPTDPRVQQAIEQLGDDDRATRDVAEKKLVLIGKSACDSLNAALSDPRPEVQRRARRALRYIQLFLVPDVSDEALSIAQVYLSNPDFDHRKPLLNRLFQMQPQPNVVLTRLITLEGDEDLRRQTLYQISTGYREAIPRMLVDDNDLPGVLSVLNQSAEMWGRSEAADDAVTLYLANQIDARIAICSAEQINGDTVAQERAATQLCYLYRVCSKYDQAMKYARLSRDQSLIFLVLQDQADWSAAAKEPDDRWRDPIVAAAYHAAYQRLAGHPDAALDIIKRQSGNAANDTDGSFSPSRLFLLNDMPERGIELLADQHPDIAFEMRVARGEIPQAIAIIGRTQNAPPALTEAYDRFRQSLGELPQPATQPTAPAEPDLTPADKAWQQAVVDLRKKNFLAAADEFGAMWAIDRVHFDRLYLQGYALQQAGQTERGQSLMHLAEMLPLGDSVARWQFAGQLDAAGLTDIAEQQRDLALRGDGDADDVGTSEIFNTRAANAIEQKQWRQAADALDRLCLIHLSGTVQWSDPVRLLTIPALAHLCHAKDAREHHDMEAMMRELKIFQQYEPLSSDMVLDMVPALDGMGEHARADELFNGVYDKLAAICQKYPKSVTYLNELAWMAACCDRRLDDALAASQTTVRLQPDDWQVLDTLAEVNFRRGDRAAAIDIEKHAMSMTSDPYIARQVKRFESAAIPPTTQPGPPPE